MESNILGKIGPYKIVDLGSQHVHRGRDGRDGFSMRSIGVVDVRGRVWPFGDAAGNYRAAAKLLISLKDDILRKCPISSPYVTCINRSALYIMRTPVIPAWQLGDFSGDSECLAYRKLISVVIAGMRNCLLAKIQGEGVAGER